MIRKMNRQWVFWALLLMGSFLAQALNAQEGRLLGGTGQGAKDSPCPLCGQPFRGRVDLEIKIPEKLPAPKNQLFISKLRRVLTMEKLARAQFEADQKKFGITNPYHYIIPQIDLHIDWIKKLFSAYGIATDEKSPPWRTAESVLQALKNGRKLEKDLSAQYEWLLNQAEDKVTKRVLNTMLTQTNLNAVMFQNALRIFQIEGSMAPLLL
jgi:hypothetical protein